MTSIEGISNSAAAIPDGDLRAVVLCLVEELSNHLSDHEAQWTYKGLSKLARVDLEDPRLIQSVSHLVSSHDGKLLDMHFLYFDPAGINPEGYEIGDEDVRLAFSHGYLVDPIDGREVANFEATLMPYFKISESVKSDD